MARFGAGNQGGDYADMARAMGARGVRIEDLILLEAAGVTLLSHCAKSPIIPL